MGISKPEARALLKEKGLRVTAPRLAVLRVLGESKAPLSHTDVVASLGDCDWDPATVYRNLVKLRDSGIAAVVSRADGIDRYALKLNSSTDHNHPHFVCDACGQVACLPADMASSISIRGRWAASVRGATIQLRGDCPDCIRAKK